MICCQEWHPEPDPPPPSLPASKKPANNSSLGSDTWGARSCDGETPWGDIRLLLPQALKGLEKILFSEPMVDHNFNLCLLFQKNSLVRRKAGTQGKGVLGQFRKSGQFSVSEISALHPNTHQDFDLEAVQKGTGGGVTNLAWRRTALDLGKHS